MKKLLYSGLTALMMFFAFGSAKAQDEEAVTKLTSPTFTPETGATITPQSTINFTLPADLNVANYMGMAFILYVENKPDVTLESTSDILMAAMQDLMGDGPGGFDGDGDASDDAPDYEIAVYMSTEDDGSDVIALKPVTISTESGAVAFRARLAVIGTDDDSGDDIVLYSDQMTADYTVAGEVVVVKPTAPTFSLAEGPVAENAELTLSNGYTGMQVSLHPMYYVIDGSESDFTSVTNMSAVDDSDLEEYTPADETSAGDVILIDRNMTILAATAEIDYGSGNIVWSDIISKSYTIATAPVVETTATPTFKVGEETKTSYELAADEASVTVTIVAADGATVYYTLDGTEPTTATTATGNSVEINSACTLKAIAKEADKNASEVASFEVTKAAAPVEQKVAAPTFDPEAGEVDANTAVTIASTTPEATVYYRKGETGEYAEYTAAVAITEACTLYAFATKTGMTNSDTVDAAYTIVAVPADEEGAPALTFTPANTDSVDNNTEILISGAPAGYSIEYGTYATVTDAKNAFYGNMYGAEGYPTVTEEEPVLKVSLIDRSTYAEFTYYRVYRVRAASDVPMPMIMSENAMAMEFGLYSKGEKVKIVAGDMDAIWYTTDGSKPAIDGATSTKIEGDAGEYTLDASVTIKAIAVKDGKASDVASAHFKLYEDATATVSLLRGMSPLDSIAGKNSPITVAFACEESPFLTYMFPYTVYYTTDGTTEPDKDAYKEGGAIKKSESPMGEEGPEGNPSILISNEGATTVKAKVYMHVYMEGELDEWIVSQTVSATIDSIVYGLADPEFTVQSGEVRMGDTIRIKNLNEFDEEKSLQASQTYFSVNGPLPSSDLASLDLSVVYRTSEDEVEDVVIIIEEDGEGTYAHIPSNEKYYDGSDKIYFEGELHIQAICYDMAAYGEGMIPGMLEYGSDFVEATYTVMKDFAKPVITPDGGIVSKGEEVEITAGEGLDIYYTIDGSEPVKGEAATKKYESPVVVNEALTLKAIAFKAGAAGARDSVSAVAVAVFTLVPEIAVKPVGHREVNDSIIFADGNVAFDMFIKEFTEADRVYKLNVTVWNTANEEDFPLADEFEAADSVRFVNTYYNGKYEATFELMQPDRRGGYIAAQDTTITFYVTENEEVVDNYELIVKPVGVAEGEEVVFTTEEVAFDVFVKGLAEDNDLKLQAIIYTKAEYDSMKNVEPQDVRAAADSVRFSAKLADGEYVGMIRLTREIRGEESIVEEASCAFTVKKKEDNDTTAVETKELAGVNVYPNPTEGEFNVVAPANANVEIFNAAGVLVKRLTVAEGNVQVRLNNSGIYFVRVRANGQMAVKKVVIR